jgi:hypothetical protein
MNSRNTDKVEPMDYKTSRAICDAVGERLERDIHAEYSNLSRPTSCSLWMNCAGEKVEVPELRPPREVLETARPINAPACEGQSYVWCQTPRSHRDGSTADWVVDRR